MISPLKDSLRMQDERAYQNNLWTVGDERGMTFEQRYNSLLAAFRALANHPALDDGSRRLLEQAYAILVFDIQHITWFPCFEKPTAPPFSIVKYKMLAAFTRFMSHPETSGPIQRFVTSVSDPIIAGSANIKACPNRCPTCHQSYPPEDRGDAQETRN